MAQVTEYVVPGSPLSMAQLKTALDNMFAAAVSANRGASPPSNPFEGMFWWDSSGAPTDILKRYTVTAGWVNLMSVNITTGAVNLYRAGTLLGTMATATATDYVAKALFDANTILAATSDDTPAAITIAEQRIVGRITGGAIGGLTAAQVLTVLGLMIPVETTIPTTSGSTVDLTSIPAGITWIDIVLSGIETSGTETLCLQIGDSGGLETTGYTGRLHIFTKPSSISAVNSTTLFPLVPGSADPIYGTVRLVKGGSGEWVSSGNSSNATNKMEVSFGHKTLSGTLDRLQFSIGGDTFSAGNIIVRYGK